MDKPLCGEGWVESLQPCPSQITPAATAWPFFEKKFLIQRVEGLRKEGPTHWRCYWRLLIPRNINLKIMFWNFLGFFFFLVKQLYTNLGFSQQNPFRSSSAPTNCF